MYTTMRMIRGKGLENETTRHNWARKWKEQ